MPQFNSLDLVSVGSLLREKKEWLNFYVPAYQRGYRWSAEQVEQLIDDLEEFNTRRETNRDAFYCLQPLVVRPIEKDGTEYLEVIDGQQRLTTILLLLQVLRQLQFEDENEDEDKKYFSSLPRYAYDIKYETRKHSSEWLPQLGETLFSAEKYAHFDDQNCDYSHFAEVFNAAYKKLKVVHDLDDFKKTLRKYTYFIWYLPSEGDDKNVEIFDRLNAGKIGLNNAELVKALLLQRSNVPAAHNAELSERDVIQKIALEWDAIERRLHDDSLWDFIYSEASHGLAYESRIEYFLDLQKGKTDKLKEKHYFTFNAYLDSYRQMMKNGGYRDPAKRLEWVKQQWDGIKNLFDLVMEWYENRHLYHRVGFIIEYNSAYDLKKLQALLPPLNQGERIAKLDDIIRDTVKGIQSNKLFHGHKELSEILFLYNILLEDRRHNDTARFSFADYKQVRKDKGWDQEHVASSHDHEPDEKEQKELAVDLIELITGNKPIPVDDEGMKYKVDVEDKEEEDLCEQLLSILNKEDGEELPKEKLEKIFKSKYFEDNFSENTFETVDKREKDFIWNFVLLNSSTNSSYGNNSFPVKRRRILADEFEVYTPVGTRNVFEKAYSRKIEHFMAWTRTDAKAYWEDIKRVLNPYVQLKDIK
ncbi:MAG: DUF262 domain-containing protein [Muribaculaceae bacterium]|nr:DUF262 domain-containing protein [Muribaculaceae bacterium]